MAIWFQHVRRFLMICGNISSFFFLFFFSFGLVFFLFFSFFNLPPLLCFGPLRILCLKEIEAIELILTLSCFTKAFHYLRTKPKKPKLPLLPTACQKHAAESTGMSTPCHGNTQAATRKAHVQSHRRSDPALRFKNSDVPPVALRVEAHGAIGEKEEPVSP